MQYKLGTRFMLEIDRALPAFAPRQSPKGVRQQEK